MPLLEPIVRPGNPQLSHDANIGPKLADLGIDKHQSCRWRLEATVPEDRDTRV
jgi:hypothetical protein